MNVPNDVDNIANIIRPPIWTSGINEENINAANPILENTSKSIGYPTLLITFILILLLILNSFKLLKKSKKLHNRH